jgi:hypothetical protein
MNRLREGPPHHAPRDMPVMFPLVRGDMPMTPSAPTRRPRVKHSLRAWLKEFLKTLRS